MITPNTAFAAAVALRDKLPSYARESITDPDWVAKVRAFHHFYEVPMMPIGHTDNSFNHMTNERVALRAGFQVEELLEFFEKGLGLKASFTIVDEGGSVYSLDGIDRKEDARMIAEALNTNESCGKHRNGKEVADAATDSVYFWIGFLLECGYDLRATMNEVHASNMTKPDENGQPIMSEDGKVLKGPNYVEPNLAAALGMDVARPRRRHPDKTLAGYGSDGKPEYIDTRTSDS